jgi:CRISPR-associated protein Csx16
MTTYFVSRHPGALDWAHRQGLAVDQWLAHLNAEQVRPGDTVAGTLPVHLAAQVCERGARYLHLCVDVPSHGRGREMSAEELVQAGARLAPFEIRAQSIGQKGSHAPL